MGWVVGLAWRGGTARHRALRSLSVEGLVAPGAHAGVCSPEQDSHRQGLCGQAGPLCFTACFHMKIPARSGGCSSLSQTLSLPSSSLGSPGRKAVRKGAL